MTNLTLSYVSRKNTDKLLRGELSDDMHPLIAASDLNPKHLNDDEYVAVFSGNLGDTNALKKPSLLVVPSNQIRDFLAWCATYQQDFAPISQWCRVIDTSWMDGRNEIEYTPTLDGLEAAWAGAIVGEVIARQGMNLSDISLVWCLSSGTFAYARALALWPNKATPEKILNNVDEARTLLRSEPRRELSGLSNVWRVLTSLQNPASKTSSNLQGAQKAILSACKEILNTGAFSGANTTLLSEYSEIAGAISDIDAMNAEDRVRLIDTIMPYAETARSQKDQDSIDVISFLVGYAIGRVGAGEANLELLLPYNGLLPMASVWCPVIAGLYKPIPWSNALNGLGRLVVKELSQPLRIDETPRTDICLEELRAMINPKVNFKRLPFRPASNRVAMVEIMPGVELAVNLRQDKISRPTPVTRNTEAVTPKFHPDLSQLPSELLKLAEKYMRVASNPSKPKSSRFTRKKNTSKTSSKKKTRQKKNKDPKLL